MGKRRFITTSEDEEEAALPPPSSYDEVTKRKRKLREEDSENPRRRKRVEEEQNEDDEEVTPLEDANPIGDVIRTSGKGRGKKNHYAAFEYDGNRFELEDPVLLTPEEKAQKPYVAIIKDITQDRDGNMMVTGQWFYRPEEAEKKGGGSWEARDARQLFYSFHRDDVPAESVMHKCVVHFVPLNKQLPLRSLNPGFIVQKVYDTVERKLWKLTDKDYEDSKQHEIDLLVQKTRDRLGELPDIEPEEGSGDPEELLKNKRILKKKNVTPIDVSREDDGTSRSEQLLKAETPGSCTSDLSEFYTILANFKALTGDMYRDKWLEKLLDAIKIVCNLKENVQADDKQKNGPICAEQNLTFKNGSERVQESQDIIKVNGKFQNPGMMRVPSIASTSSPSTGTVQASQNHPQPWMSTQGKQMHSSALSSSSYRPQMKPPNMQRTHLPQQYTHSMPTSHQQHIPPSHQQQQQQPSQSHQSQEHQGQQYPSARIPQTAPHLQQVIRGPGSANQKSLVAAAVQPNVLQSGPLASLGSNEIPDGGTHILSKRSIQELVTQIDPSERLDPEVEDVLVDIAEDFVESITTFACSLAKHRKSTTLEAKDILLHLERNWNMTLPGFGGDELKAYKKPLTNDVHRERLAAIKKSVLGTEAGVPKNSTGQAAANMKGHTAKAPVGSEKI